MIGNIVYPRVEEAVRVAVVDDQPLFREGVCNALGARAGYHIVAEGAHFDDVLTIANDTKPSVMLLDVNLPGGGIRAAAEIAKLGNDTKAVMLANLGCENDLAASFKAGARGYVVKKVGGAQLADIIRTVHSGGVYTEPTFAGALLAKRYERVADSGMGMDALTCREREILDLVSLGKTNKEAARNCKISEKTVKHYMTNILQKLQARNRVEAVLIARHWEASA